MTTATQSLAIRAPIDCVFDLIADFASYPGFLPEIERAKVMKKSAKGVRVAFTANLMQRVDYTLNFELTRPNHISWTLVEADPIMKENCGTWELTSLKKNLTEVTFTADIELGIWMPKMILEGLAKSNLSAMLKAFKKRAEQ